MERAVCEGLFWGARFQGEEVPVSAQQPATREATGSSSRGPPRCLLGVVGLQLHVKHIVKGLLPQTQEHLRAEPETKGSSGIDVKGHLQWEQDPGDLGFAMSEVIWKHRALLSLRGRQTWTRLLLARSASLIGGERSSELFGQMALFGQTSGTGITTAVRNRGHLAWVLVWAQNPARWCAHRPSPQSSLSQPPPCSRPLSRGRTGVESLPVQEPWAEAASHLTVACEAG